TLARTTLSQMCLGSLVNLERSAKIGEEIGGHLLSGHIYGTAQIAHIMENVYTFSCITQGMKYLFTKGFIAIDGISLTLVEVDRKKCPFSVNRLPETQKRPTQGQKRKGALVNLKFAPLPQVAVETVKIFLTPRL